MRVDAQRFLTRRSQMMGDKQLHVPIWWDCYRMSLPERGSGLQSDILTASEAQQHKARIYDSTAPDSTTRTSVKLLSPCGWLASLSKMV